MRRRIRIRKRVVALTVVLMALTAACGDPGAVSVETLRPEGENGEVDKGPKEKTPSPDPTTTPSQPGSPVGGGEPATTLALQVWLNRGENLSPAVRFVEPTQAVGRAAIEALLGGPSRQETAAGLGTQVPAGTQLLDLSIDSGTATVDLTGDFESGGGSLSMSMRLAQVVYTLTQFPTVKDVSFRLDGRPVEAFSGQGIVLDHPVGRSDYEDLVAPIVVYTPAIGQEISSPLKVSGTANVFEATVSMRLLDEDGKVMVEKFTTATCGSGCRGDYSAMLSFVVAEPQDATLQVYESSAEDGRPIHVVAIPVRLLP